MTPAVDVTRPVDLSQGRDAKPPGCFLQRLPQHQPPRTCPADHVRSQMTRAAAVAVPRKM
ncbi:hypothetical protein [Streptomyces sp. NPDC126514]|uniref:hypothetical protein n=1 Tax=Streptomyces sp. NPDC126514 TaxID=3155210 RepID=UPI00332C2825